MGMAVQGHRRSTFFEIGLVSALFVLGAVTGMVYVSTWGGRPVYLQSMFGPAVMWTCGRGFENPKLSQIPSLRDFLYAERDSFSCSEIPDDVPLAPHEPGGISDEEWKLFHPHPDFSGWLNFQRFHYYLLMSAALCWKVFGISWTALLPLFGLLYGTSVAASYGLFRLAMKRWPAVVFALFFLVAPLHLQELPDLRDYAKAPFFLTVAFLMGRIAVGGIRQRTQLSLCALCGAVLGLGVGFRQDLLICAPAFLAVLFVFSPGPWRETWRTRCLGSALFMALFLVIGGPILHVLFWKGNNSSHDTLIGTLQYCDSRLGVGSPYYDLGDPFLDEYVRAEVESFNDRINGSEEPLRHYTIQYDRVASEYFMQLVRTLPADFLIRAYASVMRIIDELRADSRAPYPRGITNPILLHLYDVYDSLMRLLLTHGRYVAALVLLIIAGRNLRLGICTLFLLCWFAGYPALRFSVRHCFHLHIISLWMAAFLCQRILDGIPLLLTARGRVNLLEDAPAITDFVSHAWVNTLCFAAIAVAGFLVPLNAARAYQQNAVVELFSLYDSASLQPVSLERTPTGDAQAQLFRIPGFANLDLVPKERRAFPIQTEYLVVEMGPAERNAPITLLYEAADPMFDFSRAYTVQGNPHPGTIPTRVFFPVYFSEHQRFVGIRLRTEDAPLLKAVYRVQDIARFPLLLNATLDSHWRNRDLFFKMTR